MTEEKKPRKKYRRPPQVKGYYKPPAELVEQGKELLRTGDVKEEGSLTKAQAALSLRIAGAGWKDIAETLDYSSPGAARGAITRVLASELNDQESVEEVRYLESRRIERILTSLMRRATDPKDPDHLAYANTALAAIKQHSKLHGAEAPAQVNLTYNPTQQQLEQWATAVAGAMQNTVEEADILDAEVID